ncbi:MAG: hypothetical protein IJ527_10545 [Prevotella sp.]|nr:hypothetical protein [Prevotella sp.]
MNRNEKKYAARYLELHNKYGNNLPNAEYDQLSQLRQQLGIRLERALEINSEIVREAGGTDIVPIRKTPLMKGKNISLDYNKQLNDDTTSPYERLLNEVSQYEATVDEILTEVAYVSGSMLDIKKQFTKLSGNLIKEGIRLMKQRGSKYHGRSKTALAVSASGAALGLAAYVFDSYRQRMVQQKKQEQLEKLLEKKREIAQVRLENIERLRDSFKENITTRMQQLYLKEFEQEIDIDDPLREQKIDSFRRDFVLTIKTRYLSDILDYVVAEMQAWQHGQQNSSLQRPDINRLIDGELMTWPKRLSVTNDDGTDWDDMLLDYIRTPRTSYPYPVYLMFSEPYMLRTYVGVDLLNTTNASEPLLKLAYQENRKSVVSTDPDDTQVSIPIQHILEKNDYYNDCVRLIDDTHMPKPKGFGKKDFAIVAVYVAVLLLLAVLIWQTDGIIFTLLAII